MSERDYSKLTVNILKEELKKRGLDQAGKKADLISRLESDDLNHSTKTDLVYTNEDTSNTEELNETSDQSSLHKESYEKVEQMDDKNEPKMDQQSEDDDPSIMIQEDSDHNKINGSNEDIQQDNEDKSGNENIDSMKDELKDSLMDHDLQQEGNKIDKVGEPGEQNDTDECNEQNSAKETQQDNPEKEKIENVETKESENNSSMPEATDETENKKEKDKINTEEDARIANEYCIEMKREKDEFQLKWRGKKFSVPFIGEIVIDLAKEISNRSFQVKQIQLKDLKSSCFENIINESLKFLIDFQSNILEASNTGFAKFIFKSNEECEKYKDSIKNYNDNITVEPVKFEDQLMHQFLNKDLSFYKGSIVDRLLYVGNLPFDVTQSTVGDLFPDALRLIFPPLKEIDQSINTARYVYLEYASADDVINATENYKDVTLNGEKLFIIKALCVKKERFGLLTDTLRMILLDKVRKLKKIQKTPYGKSRQELQEVDKGISLNMDKLATDSKHRKSWGMELGALDEERIEKEEPEKPESVSQRGGGIRGGRGSSRGSYDSRRPTGSNIGHQQRYGNFSNYNNYNNSAVRPGWTAGNYYGTSGFVNHGFINQGYSQGYGGHQGTFYGNKRKGSDSYGGDWKRGRTF